MRYFLITLLLAQFTTSVFGQDLLQERIWKISSRKRSIFFDKGVFHSDTSGPLQELKSVRNSFVPARGYERIVFDFDGVRPPKVYGHINKKEKKVFVDLFNVNLNKKFTPLKNVKYLQNIDFFNIDKNNVSLELSFVDGVSFDIFYLENPGRLVIDVKK